MRTEKKKRKDGPLSKKDNSERRVAWPFLPAAQEQWSSSAHSSSIKYSWHGRDSNSTRRNSIKMYREYKSVKEVGMQECTLNTEISKRRI